MSRKFILALSVLLLASFLSACRGGSGAVPASPTAGVDSAGVPVAGPLAGEELSVVNVNVFLDPWGKMHLAGEIRNNSTQAMTGIELSVEIVDAAGNSLLSDPLGSRVPALFFRPLLVTLAPGELAPFAYTFDMALGTPADYSVTVAGYQAGSVDRANLVVEHVNLADDGRGALTLTGEVLNTGSEWVRLNALAGGVLDAGGTLLSADWSASHASMLAPAGDIAGHDRTPFVITFAHPGGTTLTPNIYLDADLTNPPTEFQISVDSTNSYYDQYGAYHIVGTLTNHSAWPVDTRLVAGLYASDGTVLDACAQEAQVTLAPGEMAPFDFSTFNNLNYDPAVSARLMSFSVRFDPGPTIIPGAGPLRLATTGDQVSVAGSTVTVTGAVTNSSANPLGRITVLVALRDGDGMVLASNFTYAFPAGVAIQPGEGAGYEVQVELAPGVDATTLTLLTLAEGE